MASEQDTSTEIALNVTRTRVTVLGFNLTITVFMLSMMAARGTATDYHQITHLSSTIALFVGFCLTLLGLFWLLASQNWDAEGLSRSRSFTLGAMTTYLALSQTITAFMHEYLIAVKAAIETSATALARPSQVHTGIDALGDTELLILPVLGGIVWTLTTYAGPLVTGVKSPVRGGWRWVYAGYYLALQLPIYWVYAWAWRLGYASADQPMNMLRHFALQFVQPLLWFR